MNTLWNRHRGLTIVELLVVIAIIGVLVGLLLPHTRGAREAARRMSCSNNFKHVGIALQNYHSANNHFPAAMSGTGIGTTDLLGNANRLSGMVALLPFLEQQALWEDISQPSQDAGTPYPAMGPAPWIGKYRPWRTQVPSLRCASAASETTGFGLTNYAFSIGDTARQVHDGETIRGMFVCRQVTRGMDVLDGLAHTIAMAEVANRNQSIVYGQVAINQPRNILDDPLRCRQTVATDSAWKYATDVLLSDHGRGGRWADGAATYGLVNTVLPPNSPSCAVIGGEATDGLYSSSSFHGGGSHVLMGSGAVVFVTDSIESGDQHQATISKDQLEAGNIASPHGLWGALGTAAADDAFEDTLYE